MQRSRGLRPLHLQRDPRPGRDPGLQQIHGPARFTHAAGHLRHHGGDIARRRVRQRHVFVLAGGGTGDVYTPATGTWTAIGPMVYPYASSAAALLPNGQVLYAGGRQVKYCGQ